jgi:NTE family protein
MLDPHFTIHEKVHLRGEIAPVYPMRTKYFITIIFLTIFTLVSYSDEPLSAELKKSKAFRHFKKRPKIGLVLSGGGAKGIAHIGVLKIIEQTGLKIDYITGTSMGSIVGGLYASGYNADMLENLVLSLDWEGLLADNVERKNISIEEKKENEKYIGSLQITKKGIKLPMGIKRGQQLTSVMSYLTLHVQHIDDFNNLPIPFRCIATDLVTGEAYVLKKGFLPDAMRASMSIPSIFTPIEIDDRLLVDGGVIRNLPVSDAREMGADIIIAIDVGARLYKKEELKSVVDIMDQSVSFLGAKSTQEQRLLTDVLVVPDIEGFSSSEFTRGKELIAIGEKAGRIMLPELKELADLQRQYEAEKREPVPLQVVDKMRITKIEINGLKKVSRNLVLGKLIINPPMWVTREELAQDIDRLYASNFFERVTYQIKLPENPIPGDNEYTLVINVVEASGIFIKVGLNYDSDMNAAVLANITMRNIAGEGSKLSIDARLSDNYGLMVEYGLHTGLRKPGIGIKAALHFDKYSINTYNNTGGIESRYNYYNYGADFGFEATIINYAILGAAVQKDLTNIMANIAPDDPKQKDIEGLNYYAYLMFDNLDRTFYPRSGLVLYGEAKCLTDDLPMMKNRQEFKTFMKYTAKVKGYIPFHKRFTMFLGATGGFIQAHEPYYLEYTVVSGLSIYRKQIPFIYQNYFGGLNTYSTGCFPFTGLNFMQISGKNVIILDAGFQIEPVNDFFIVIRGSVGRAKKTFEQLFQKKNMVISQYYGLYLPRYEHLKNDLVYGYGLTLGYNTPIGPIEVSLMRGSESNKFLFHVNIGYRI